MRHRFDPSTLQVGDLLEMKGHVLRVICEDNLNYHREMVTHQQVTGHWREVRYTEDGRGGFELLFQPRDVCPGCTRYCDKPSNSCSYAHPTKKGTRLTIQECLDEGRPHKGMSGTFDGTLNRLYRVKLDDSGGECSARVIVLEGGGFRAMPRY